MPVGAASWSFTEDDFAAITHSLQRFLHESNARCALLVDRSGQLVATVGEQPKFDPTAFATLTAADFSANDQLAKLIGESDFNSLFHQGEKESMYLADVARRVILVVLFDNRTTLGMVRLKMRPTVQELTQMFEQMFARSAAEAGSTPHILEGADDEIDKLFREEDSAMSIINYPSREINCKIVYYGPGLGGKTTNLEIVYGNVEPDTRGKLISLATETERTLFFDFFPLDLGTIRGFKTRFHLYTVPGQVYYNASRKLILKGVDGVVFVADSQEPRMEANIESLRNLEQNLKEHGFDLATIPYALQFNKRDLPSVVPVEEMYRTLNYKREPTFEAVATTGVGVFDTLKSVAKQILIELKKR